MATRIEGGFARHFGDLPSTVDGGRLARRAVPPALRPGPRRSASGRPRRVNLLQTQADSVGVAVARNDQTRYKTFWAMVIAEKSPKRKDRKATVGGDIGPSENAIHTVKNFVCKYLC